MKQNSMVINLREFTSGDHPFGNVQGRQTYNKLAEFIDANPSQAVFGISLNEIVATDASFPRESIIAIAKQYRGEKGFFLEGIKSRDLIDNWNYAARAKEQPLVIWSEEGFELIGPEVSSSTKALLEYIFANLSVTTSRVASDLHITVQNASTQLKKLVNLGFIMRSEEIAESGGLEYIYNAIK